MPAFLLWLTNNNYQRGVRVGQVKKGVWKRKKVLSDFAKPKTCVECNKHKEIYMAYYCESCYRKALTDKLDRLGEE